MSDKVKVLEEKIKEMEESILSLQNTISSVVIEVNRTNIKVDGKIDADKIVSAINETKETERIKGKELHITKESLIEYGSIPDLTNDEEPTMSSAAIDDNYSGNQTQRLNELSSIEVGKLSDEELKRWNLGPYSKNNTPGSRST